MLTNAEMAPVDVDIFCKSLWIKASAKCPKCKCNKGYLRLQSKV